MSSPSTTAVAASTAAAATATETAGPRHTTSKGMRATHDARTGWAFMAPFCILFAVVFLIPIGVSIYQSFFRKEAAGGLYGGGESTNLFVGFDNYAHTLTNGAFWSGMGRVVVYGLFQIPIMMVIALGLALLIDSWLVKRVGAFRLAYFLPYAIPGIVAAMVWLYLYTPEISPIVKGLHSIGIPVDFLSQNTVLASMANMTTWTYTGYNMLIFLAALQAIPRDIYEAAHIDGASEWQIIRQIKIPMVGGAALLAALLSIIGTVQLFNEPTVIAAVTPWMGADYTPMMMAYNTMMGHITPGGDGPASAVSICMALLAGILAVGYTLLQRKVAK